MSIKTIELLEGVPTALNASQAPVFLLYVTALDWFDLQAALRQMQALHLQMHTSTST